MGSALSAGWTRRGNEADPETPLFSDAAYTALIAPALAGGDMEPWLECDENGFALPGALITGEEAAAGAEAIFASDFDAGLLGGARERHRLRLCPGP